MVTARIVERSRDTRADYLDRMAAAASRARPRQAVLRQLGPRLRRPPRRGQAAAAQPECANIAIVSAYNDMLSAHQPLERFPAIIKAAAHEAGATAQYAGGAPAMCDGVTQGRPGMELSLFSAT